LKVSLSTPVRDGYFGPQRTIRPINSRKRERIRRRTYKTREEARQDVFDYIEMFYNPVHKHVSNGMLSLAQFERQQILKAEGA